MLDTEDAARLAQLRRLAYGRGGALTQEQADELEDRHPDFGAAYSIEVEALGKKNTREERELLVRLTERERAEIEHL